LFATNAATISAVMVIVGLSINRPPSFSEASQPLF
jgi:hypothetical protein